MKKIIFLLLTCISIDALAQSVGIGITSPHNTAALEIRSINKGVLMPRLTAAARQSMFGVPAGMMVYDTDAATFYYHDGNKWRPIYDQNPDSNFVDYGVNPEVTANMTTLSATAAMSGILYDNGGPAGNYANNSNNQYRVDNGGVAGNDSVAMYKVVIEEMNLEAGDSLFIYVDFDNPVIIKGTTLRTLYFHATDNLSFLFVSNGTGTQAGFKIRWSKLVGHTTEVEPQMGWYFNTQRRAVRGGINIGDNWDVENLGNVSFGWGAANKATGRYSTAIGQELEATGSYAVAMGYRNVAGNAGATALGQQCNATGAYSFAAGFGSDASGSRSTALGESSDASGDRSFAAGHATRAKGAKSVAMGWGTIAKAYWTVLGRFNDTLANYSETDWIDTDPLFMIGNGTSTLDRSNALLLTKAGRLGVGTNFPRTKLHVDGGTDASMTNNSGYLVIGDISSSNIVFDNNEIMARNNGVSSTLFLQNSGGAFEVGGTAAKPGGGSWAATSDARLKEDVRPYTDGLLELLRINPVYYRYNKQSGYDTQKEYVGVLAQELQRVAPYMVNVFKKDSVDYLSVDNTAMMYMLINAVKEQQQQIEALKEQKQEIEMLKKKIEALEKR